MKFKPGMLVKTRDGREVEILKVDAPGDLPIIGMFLSKPLEGHSYGWSADGIYLYAGDSGRDLLPPKRTREVRVWVNVYEASEAVHITKSDAECSAESRALAVAVPATVTIEY